MLEFTLSEEKKLILQMKRKGKPKAAKTAKRIWVRSRQNQGGAVLFQANS